MKAASVISLVILGLCATLYPQEKAPDPTMETLLNSTRTLYYAGDYRKAIETLQEAKNHIEEMETRNRIDAYKYLAYSYIAFGEIDKAKSEFRRILEIAPDFTIDSISTSPKIVDVFRDAKKEYHSKVKRNANDGVLQIQAIPWANIYLDDKFIGTTPMVYRLSPGEYALRLDCPSLGENRTINVSVEKGKITKRSVNMGGQKKR